MKNFAMLCILNLVLLYNVTVLANDQRTIDITHYHLSIQVEPQNQSIRGVNVINFKTVYAIDSVQFDLDSNFTIDNITSSDKSTLFRYNRKNNKILIYFKTPLLKEKSYSLNIYYHGIPRIAPHAPWEGGFVWSKDSLNNSWIGVACEGEGARLWWPCEDDPSDEPDSMKISVTCPGNLFCVSNGTLIKIEDNDSLKTYHWQVHYPINNYNVTLNIADYVHFSDTLLRKDKSKLPLDYYVLRYNLTKAEQHFKQVKTILTVYEKFFGPYPFPKDGYALVETPYWGMEHQSAIAYGNKYKTNMGPYDFIIVHETAHEWWGNSITASRLGQLWIHEAFATYAESLLIEDQLGKEKTLEYLEKQKLKIKNEAPMASLIDEMRPEDSDIYYKGTWMLHTIRHCINDDKKWFELLLEFSIKNHCQILTTEDVIQFFAKHLSKKLTPVFSHYLYKTTIPLLHYSLHTNKKSELILEYHWERVDKKFKMPFLIKINQKEILLFAKTKKRHTNLGVIDKSVVGIQTQLQYIDVVKDDN